MNIKSKNKILFVLLTTILISCATTTFNPSAGTTKTFTVITKEIAGSPNQPNTKIVITKTIQNVSRLPGDQLTQSLDLIDPNLPQKKPDEALRILNSIPTENLNIFETALIHLSMGRAMIAKEDYTRAIEQYNFALSKKDYLPIDSEASTLFILAQLYAATKNYKLALEYIYKYADYVAISDAHYFLIASLQNKANDTENAIKNITKAITLSKDEGSIDSDYYELQSLLYEKINQSEKAEKIKTEIKNLKTNIKQNEITPLAKIAYKYPAKAFENRIEGYCIVNFTINPFGNVDDAFIKPGNCKTIQGKTADFFLESSIEAVNNLEYLAIRKKGVPIDKEMTYEIRYTLEK